MQPIAKSDARKVLVRPAEARDQAQWLRLWDEYNAFYGRSGITKLARPVSIATWTRFFSPAEPMHAIVAEHDGELVGIAHFLFHPSTSRLMPLCYLEDLFTDERHRRAGVGRALIDHVADYARALDCEFVYWQTHRTNQRAMRLYDKVAKQTEFRIYRKIL